MFEIARDKKMIEKKKIKIGEVNKEEGLYVPSLPPQDSHDASVNFYFSALRCLLTGYTQ